MAWPEDTTDISCMIISIWPRKSSLERISWHSAMQDSQRKERESIRRRDFADYSLLDWCLFMRHPTCHTQTLPKRFLGAEWQVHYSIVISQTIQLYQMFISTLVFVIIWFIPVFPTLSVQVLARTE